MDNIHAPTVPSGPSSRPLTNGNAKHLSFAELQAKKEDLEAELKTLSGVLDSHGVNMETPLITADGFPRADIDVAQIRTTRTRIIHLKNDYKDLMNAIEKHLHEHFASIQDTEDATPTSASRAQMLGDSIPVTLGEPFAKVNSVVAGSPADSAGLKPGDEIRNFGYVNGDNHDDLKKVAECVQGNEGVSQNLPRIAIAKTQCLSRKLILDTAKGPRQNISPDRVKSKARVATQPNTKTKLGRARSIRVSHSTAMRN
ncbi:putative 26S proteasome regulatory subunit [Parahypoxylon ruwenzoriense]